MKKFKRYAAFFMAAAMLATTVVGCGEKENNETTTAGTTTTAAPTTTPAPTTTEAPKPEVVKLSVKTSSSEIFTDRAMVAVKAKTGVLVSWRCYETDSKDIVFTLERNGEVVYTGNRTNYMDAAGNAGDTYKLTAVTGTVATEETTKAWAKEYQEFTVQAPAPQTMPDGAVTAYTANDMSTGDLDGDGQLELIIKWYPDNAQDNSKDGYTGTTFLDAYDIDVATGTATLMWRIDLGLNIRSGAHYTQFQVWDYDGDGKAELMCKTADGSTVYNSKFEEIGHVGAVSASKLPTEVAGTPETYDFRQHTGRKGRIVLGQEYLTAFDGATGAIIDTVKYVPERGPYDAEKGIYDTSMWGLKNGKAAEKNDGYANRADRFLAATGYIDDGNAAALFCRGYYGRSAITAWKLVNGKLEMQWAFDIDSFHEYAAQGNHGLSINDIDGDGFDEIIYGALVVDNNGEAMYATGLGHGDAMHVSDWNNDGKLEVFSVHEEKTAAYGFELRDALTGTILWGVNTGADTGRGMAADIDPRYPGAECFAKDGMYDCNGNKVSDTTPSRNFSIYWDGDVLMELYDNANNAPQVQKWNWEKEKIEYLITAAGASNSNGTKNNPGLLGDLYGDWREEFFVRDAMDNTKIRLYSTTDETQLVFPSLLTNRTYREGLAWQNTAYNQPANLPYLLTEDMSR